MRAKLATVLGLAAALPLGAQTSSSVIPINPAPLHYTLPRPFQTTLPNGLRVIILENHRLPTVNVMLQIQGAAGFDDPSRLVGLADETAQMMSLGAGNRDAQQIADALAALGANVNFSGGEGEREAAMSAGGLSTNFDQWFGIASDLLLHPTFPAGEWTKLEQREEVTLRQERTAPGFLAHMYLDQAIMGNYPAAPDSPTEASLRAMTTADFAEWHRTRWVPQNAILGITGDVHADMLVPQLQRWLGDWQRTDLAVPAAGAPTPVTARHIILIDRPGSVQTVISLGNIAIARDSPDFFPATVLNEIFGGGVQSRLFSDLREKQGLAYNVSSGLDLEEFPSPWRAGGNFRTAVTGQAITSLLAQVQRLNDEPVPAAELLTAQQAIVSQFALRLEQPLAALEEWIESVRLGFAADYWDKYAGNVMAVTPDDVQRAARKYYDPATVQIVAVGDAAQIEPAFAKLGTVQVLNSDGKAETPGSGNQ